MLNRLTRRIALGLAGAAALAAAVAVVPVTAQNRWTTVRIGTEGAYPPFNNATPAGELVGFEIDLAKAICEKMKVTCTFVAQDWDGIIPALLAGKYDVIIASMSITEERKKQVAFSNRYYQTPPSFIAPRNTRITDTAPAAMRGRTIGAQSSTIHANFLEDVYKAAGATIRLYGTQDEANLDLAAGRLDAVLADKVVLDEWIKAGKEGACCKLIADVKPDPKWFGDGVGAAFRQGDNDLREMFNKALAEVIADGTYKRIQAKYFTYDIL